VAILRSPDTVLEPISVESRRILSVLREGAARFEVTKRPGRLFRVVAGDVIVEVLGTRFELERVGDRLRVKVNEGRVRVSWTGGQRQLSRGASGLFPPEGAPRRTVQAEAGQVGAD
jgi:transmembrane sensor